MLSKYDIEKELINGGISIVPFKKDHIKENSYNLTASKLAWSMSEGIVFYDEENKTFSLTNDGDSKKKVEIKKGCKAVYKDRIVVLPHSTTLIETTETIAAEKNIGGTYHSKVGLVNLGLGHIGTMLGPNYCGQSLIAMHNISDEVISFSVDKSIVSVVFHYLDTPIEENNANEAGHLDKFASLGINLNSVDNKELSSDWKRKSGEIRSRMKAEPEYINFKKEYDEKKKEKNKHWFNKKNIILVISIIVIAIIVPVLGYFLDLKTGTKVWSDRAWTIVISGVIITLVQQLVKKMDK